MNLHKRIQAFSKLPEIFEKDEELKTILHKTEMHNAWFTQMYCRLMLQQFSENYFDEQKLGKWIAAYPVEPMREKNVGLVLAGNIPFVGMHDILCVLLSGHKAKIKLSSKDTFFFPWLYKKLMELEPDFTHSMEFIDRLKDFDAVIATGSNNSARYFEYYFGKYPHIIRKNRTSVAILSGEESEEEIYALGKDVFYYYGLGCRNVSKLFLPQNFEPEKLFRIWEDYRYVIENSKYKNNFEYNRALLLLNQTPHLANHFFMMEQNESLFSPLAILYYAYYTNEIELHEKLKNAETNIQCIVGNKNINFGKTQFPELNDYADNVDTMLFLKQ